MTEWILLFMSVVFNIFAVWYIRELLVRFRFYAENSEQLFKTLAEFIEHLEKVHQMEVYFGDPTIQGLLKHSKDTASTVAEYLDIFSLNEEDLIEEEEAEQEEE